MPTAHMATSTWEHDNVYVGMWECGNNIWEHMNNISERERGMASRHDSTELCHVYGLPRWHAQYAPCPPLPSATYRTCNIKLKFNIQHFTLDRSTNPLYFS
jgi:hypothetical protein